MKQRSRRRGSSRRLGVAGLAVAMAGIGGVPAVRTADPVEVALVRGPVGTAGEVGITHGLTIPVEEINARAGVLGGRKLEYNQDPGHLRDLLLYRLTLEAQKRITTTRLANREIIRRLGTSPAQLHRLLDQTNYRKSVDLLRLLQVLD